VDLRVVVAEDNLLVRTGVEALLRTERGVEVAAVYANFEELMAGIAGAAPHVLVTDIRMPPTSTDEGIRAAETLRRTQPDVGVVVLSHYLQPDYILQLVAGGSSRRGYLLKDRVADSDELISAIRTVAAGGSYIDPLVVDTLVSAEVRSSGSPLQRLTRRERDTLAEVATGKSNAAIAAAFGVSERAVEKHINAIFGKLDLPGDRDTNRRVKAVLVFLAHASERR